MTDSCPTALMLTGRSCPAGLLGGKGGALDRLLEWELPVPPTAVITTVAYRELANDSGIRRLIDRIRGGDVVDAEHVDQVFRDAAFSGETEDRLLDVMASVDSGLGVAVRSSATVEDLAGSSFAGQYRSVLGVDTADREAAVNAVKLVFASLWHPAPCAYRSAFGVDDDEVAMAAVCMQMVDADTAGVVFTVDPGGADGAARVEAVKGLGEALVSGQRTPNAWIVPRDLEGFDGPPEIAEAVRLALVVEERSRIPQDVEWACADGIVWVVQARPITVAVSRVSDGFDSAIDAAQLTTAGIGEMLPGVLPPLRWQINAHLVNEAFRRLVADLGADSGGAPRSFVRRVRGRAAMDFDALRDLASRLPGGSAEELEQQYFGSSRVRKFGR